MDLKDWSDKHSKYIKLKDGESFEGVYGGWKNVIKDAFGEEKETVRYTIDGKTLDSSSVGLSRQMAEVKVGDKIKITRSGSGPDTRYKVDKLNG